MKALYLTQDLMFSSRVRSAAQDEGLQVDVLMSADGLLEQISDSDVRLVILDLTARDCNVTELVPQIRGKNSAAHIVAYGPHVAEASLLAARDAGCHEVLTRGLFDRQARQVLLNHLR